MHYLPIGFIEVVVLMWEIVKSYIFTIELLQQHSFSSTKWILLVIVKAEVIKIVNKTNNMILPKVV